MQNSAESFQNSLYKAKDKLSQHVMSLRVDIIKQSPDPYCDRVQWMVVPITGRNRWLSNSFHLMSPVHLGPVHNSDMFFLFKFALTN